MVPIKMEKFIKDYCKNNPEADPNQIRKSLKQAVQDKKNGEMCSTCGGEIWAIGSALVYNSCFTCLTGDTDSSKDYEIDKVCW